jgi:hypothetical protein
VAVTEGQKMNLKHMVFLKHLSEKGRKKDYVEKCKALLNTLQEALTAEPLVPLENFTRTFGTVSETETGYRFLDDYAEFCEGEQVKFADAIREHANKIFTEKAKNAVSALYKAVILIPKGTKINPIYLKNLSNDEFADVFRDLQEIVLAIYQDIERTPFVWGWPDWRGLTVNGNHHNRVLRIFSSLAECGELDGTELKVNKKDLAKYDFVNRLNKSNANTRLKPMLDGLLNFGFLMEGIDDKKSEYFTLSHLDTPDIIPVMCAYFYENSADNGLSYRFVEDAAEQIYCAKFLSLTDKMSDELQEIQYWLYDEGAKYGFTYNAHNPYDVIFCDHIWYEKGTKRKPHELASKHFLVKGMDKATVKMKFSNIFKTHPDKANELMKRFPDSFGAEYTNPQNFSLFKNVTIEDIKFLFELYKVENRLKPA